MGNGNGDAGSSYMPANTAYPPIETHERREECGFPCTAGLFVAVIFFCCLLLVSMQLELGDLYDRVTGAVLHQQARICWDKARSRPDFFLILPLPSPSSLRASASNRARVYETESARVRVCVSVCEQVSPSLVPSQTD